MATQTDLLQTLPLELRQHVYSYLFPRDGNGTVWIGQNSQSVPWLSAILALPEDDVYSWWCRRNTERGGSWPKEMDEALFRAFRWASKEHPWSRQKINALSYNEIISRLVFEFTGQERCPKRVSSHIQVLKTFLQDREHYIAEWTHAEQACGVLAPNSDQPSVFSRPLGWPSNTVSRLNETSPTHYGPPYAQDLLSLRLVNRFFRDECSAHLASNVPLSFDFGSDCRAFQLFCKTAPAALIALMRHVRITFVEGYMPPFLPRWPNLDTLALDLCPRNPTRRDVKDREWGVQTEELFARLGVTVAVRASITVEMRGAADCERFEREHVGKRRWRRVTADVIVVVENGALGREEGGFCRRLYERCGDGETIAEPMGREEESASASLSLSCLLKLSRCCYE